MQQEKRYQVFISSTFRDLQEERQKVLQAVLELKAFPSGMEIFPSADDDQWEFIKREIDTSDYYVLIVAGKYGSVAPDGISFTEKEYDYAVEKKKPVHAFLVKSPDKLTVENSEKDSSQRERLEQFRSKVATGKLVRFYTNPDELKAQVMQALVHAFNFRPQEGWMRSRNARRIEDLEELNALHKQIQHLEAENTTLKRQAADPTVLLAQRDDEFQFKFELRKTANCSPPMDQIEIVGTWNDLFASLFSDGIRIRGTTLRERVVGFLVRRVREQCPDAVGWANEATVAQFGKMFLEQFVARVRIQLQGLGLIHISFIDVSEVWDLTEKGKVHCAFLIGQRRCSDPITELTTDES